MGTISGSVRCEGEVSADGRHCFRDNIQRSQRNGNAPDGAGLWVFGKCCKFDLQLLSFTPFLKDMHFVKVDAANANGSYWLVPGRQSGKDDILEIAGKGVDITDGAPIDMDVLVCPDRESVRTIH